MVVVPVDAKIVVIRLVEAVVRVVEAVQVVVLVRVIPNVMVHVSQVVLENVPLVVIRVVMMVVEIHAKEPVRILVRKDVRASAIKNVGAQQKAFHSLTIVMIVWEHVTTHVKVTAD